MDNFRIKCWNCRYCEVNDGHRCKLSILMDKSFNYYLLHALRECSAYVRKPKRGEKGYVRPEYSFRCKVFAMLQREFAQYLPSITLSFDDVNLTTQQAARMKRAGCFNKSTPDMDFSFPTFEIIGAKNYHGLKMELKPEGTQLQRLDGNYMSGHISNQHNRLLYFRKLGYHASFNTITENYACGVEGIKYILESYLGGHNAFGLVPPYSTCGGYGQSVECENCGGSGFSRQTQAKIDRYDDLNRKKKRTPEEQEELQELVSFMKTAKPFGGTPKPGSLESKIDAFLEKKLK